MGLLDAVMGWTVTVPWVIMLITYFLLFVFGALVANRFGVRWLLAIRFIFGPDTLAAMAKAMWEYNMVPAEWKRLRFGNDEDAFVRWVIDKSNELWKPEFEEFRKTATRDAAIQHIADAESPVLRL